MAENQEEPKYIKINVGGDQGGEWVWAIDKGNNTAQIRNLPLSGDYSLDDIISYDPETKIAGDIVEKKTNAGVISYEPLPDNEKMKERWKTIHDYLEENKIQVEGLIAGMASIAIPLDMPDEKVFEIIGACPEKISLITE